MQNKREVNVEVLVGLFLFVALIVLGIFTIVLGGNKLLQPHYDVEVVFSEIGGLQEGEGVYLRGKQIGYVKETILKQEQVDVTLSLDVPIEFHRGYRIEVMSASMLGGKYIKIDPGKYESPLISMDEPLLGELPVDVMAEFNTALHNLQTMMGAMGEGKGTLGSLLADDTLYKELVSLTENVNQISGKIALGEGTIGSWCRIHLSIHKLRKYLAVCRYYSRVWSPAKGWQVNSLPKIPIFLPSCVRLPQR